MSDLTFQMLLKCHYSGADNDVKQLHVEHLVDESWQELDLNTRTPGFDIFMYAILTCQHTYFRINAAERDLVLDSSEGLITLNCDQHRSIKYLHIDFTGKLASGKVTDEAVNYVTERMALCPVSINLKNIANSKTSVSFEFA